MSSDGQLLINNVTPRGEGVTEMATLRIVDIRDKLPKHSVRKWPKQKKIKRVIIHCTQSANQDPFKTARYHVNPGNHISKLGCPGLTYHDYITREGTVFHCTDYSSRVWHCGLWNSNSVAVVIAYEGIEEPPRQTQYDALILMVTRLCLFLGLPPRQVYGHREVPGMYTWLGKGSRKFKKWCPGQVVDLDELRSLICLNLQRKLSADGLYKDRIDGLFGPLSLQALQEYNRRLVYELRNQ